jgi:ABC-type enterochelin transport system permease subunit
MFVPSMLFALALAGCAALALILSRFGRQPVPSVLFWAVIGYIAAGATIWLVVPPEWTLSLPQTLAASVDSATYGHPIEHYAESLVLVMLIACLLGAVMFSAIATFGGRLLRPTR